MPARKPEIYISLEEADERGAFTGLMLFILMIIALALVMHISARIGESQANSAPVLTKAEYKALHIETAKPEKRHVSK